MTEAELASQGWQRLPTKAFSAAIGQAWVRGEAGARVVGLAAGDVIANDHARIVHGGALMTFADIALGVAAAEAIGAPLLATAQLNYQFAGAARPGQFVTCAPQVVRATSQLVFVRGLIEADGKPVGAADAVFKRLDADKIGAMRKS